MSAQSHVQPSNRLPWLGTTDVDRPAVIALKPRGEFESTSYGELASRALRFAQHIGVHSDGELAVPLYLSRSADCIAAALGSLVAGRTFAMLNRKFQLPQIERVLEETEATSLIVDGPALFALKPMTQSGRQLSSTPWTLLRNSSFSPLHEKAYQSLSEVVDISSLALADSELPQLDRPPDVTDGAGCCLFTSGSTGVPKGVLISAEDLAARAESEVACFDLTADDVLLSILPFAFDVGLNQMLSALRAGSTLVILDSWLPVDILNAVANWSVTGISGVPSVWRGMMASGLEFDTTGPHRSLRYLTISGGSLANEEVERFARQSPGVGIFKTYGQTETFRTACLLPHELERFPSSVGRPFGNARVDVVREDGTRCGVGETGEILHSGLGTMRGYLGGGTAEKLRSNPNRDPADTVDQFVYTGDLGYLNEEGYLFLEGRKDAMLKIAGNRVYPEEICHEMLKIDEVVDAEVIGVDDDEGETRTVGFAVLRQGSKLTSQEVSRSLSRQLPSYMVPQHLHFLDRMPQTESGKIDRMQLHVDASDLLNGPGLTEGSPAGEAQQRKQGECHVR